MMVVQYSKCTKCHHIVHFQMVEMANFMSCEFYHNKERRLRFCKETYCTTLVSSILWRLGKAMRSDLQHGCQGNHLLLARRCATATEIYHACFSQHFLLGISVSHERRRKTSFLKPRTSEHFHPFSHVPSHTPARILRPSL